MFATPVIERFLKEETLEAAIAKVNQYSNLMDLDPDQARVYFKGIWEKHLVAQAEARRKERLAVLSKAINNLTIMLISPEGVDGDGLLAEYIENGGVLALQVVRTEEMNEDGETEQQVSFAIQSKAHLQTNATQVGKQAHVSARRTSSGKTSYRYFHQGVAIGGALAKFVKENYPQSKATLRLLETDQANKDGTSKSKLGAWQAVESDPELKDIFTREEWS